MIMEKSDNKPKANKPLRETDNMEKSDLPYDPNINKDDKQALQERGHSMSPTDDQFLADREESVDFAAEDLDIPGRNIADTTQRGTDLPDEENFQYDKSGVKKKFRRDLDNLPDEDSDNT
jgi:hypothetical protein